MEPVLRGGTTLRRICREWSVTHDAALTILSWLLRLGYVEALPTCGVYAAYKSGGGVVNAPSTDGSRRRSCPFSKVALLDRVKNVKPDLKLCLKQAVKEDMEGVTGAAEDVWGECLASESYKACPGRAYILDSVTRTHWWERTGKGTLLVERQRGSGREPGTMDIFTVEDCKKHHFYTLPVLQRTSCARGEAIIGGSVLTGAY